MNKVILMGRLTKEPELRYATNANNTAVCKITVAVDRRFQKQGEEKQADFIPVVTFGKTGEFVSKFFTKGSRIALVGSIQTRTWDDAEGKRHYVTEVLADEAYFTESKRTQGGNTDSEPDGAGEGYYPLEDDDELPF